MTPGISFFASVPASEPQVRRATVTGVRLAWRAVPAVLAAALVASCSKPPEAMASDHVKRADAYVAEKKYRKAIVEYRNALQRLPQSGEARYKLAQAYVLTNHPTSAYREYVRAPSSLDAQLKAGQMLLLAKHFEDARTRADKALGLDSRNVQALILRGASLAGLKDVDSAIAQPEEAVELDPDRSGTYNDPGALHLAKGDAKSAETAFAKAVQVDPKSVTARLMLAVFYMSTRRAAEEL